LLWSCLMSVGLYVHLIDYSFCFSCHAFVDGVIIFL